MTVTQSQRGNGQTQSPADEAAPSFRNYEVGNFYDEMFDAQGVPRSECRLLSERMKSISANDLARRKRAAVHSMLQLGITFAVYGDKQGE